VLGHLQQIERDVSQMRRTVAGTTGTAESADGLIEATVGMRGELVDLVLDPRIFRTPDADALAEQIRTAVNEAGQTAQETVRRELVQFLPKDAGKAFTSFLGQPDPDGTGAIR
jgi:DNA-binding protein YbaB